MRVSRSAPSPSRAEGRAVPLPQAERVRGRVTANAPLAPLIWFKTGGRAETLFEPADAADLSAFLVALPQETPLLALGLGSNLIVRDGGVPGVIVRLGKPFAGVRVEGTRIITGAGAPGIAVASAARDAGLAGLEFLRGIPGTVGGAVAMNAGAYGREVADCLVDATARPPRRGTVTLAAADLGFAYRHSAVDGIVVAATFAATPGDRATIAAEMDRIAAEREASQPLRMATGGSTFANPPGHKAWALIDAAGCRGLRRGGAQVSRKAHQLPHQHRHRDERRPRRLGRGGAGAGARAQRRRPPLGNRPGGGPMKVVVLMGGWSAEREVSLTSGAGIAAACRRLGHDVTEMDLTPRRGDRAPACRAGCGVQRAPRLAGRGRDGAGAARPARIALYAQWLGHLGDRDRQGADQGVSRDEGDPHAGRGSRHELVTCTRPIRCRGPTC